MKTFKEYYDKGIDHELNWLYSQKDKWWQKNVRYKNLITTGDYIETVNRLASWEKNDSSLFVNRTNVMNSEWSILFHMLGQALVDWCVENVDWENLWSCGIRIHRTLDGLSNVYNCSFSVNRYDFEQDKYFKVTDEADIEKFSGCRDFLCDMIDWFITKHGKNIPNDWNHFSFGLDDLMASCKYGMWVCSSDGYMNLGNERMTEDEKMLYDNYVECM